MAQKITVVISKGQSDNPKKRQLEDAIAAGLADDSAVHTVIVPHLYDVQPGGQTVGQLRNVRTDLVVLSWLYPRAAHWTLDRFGIRGRMGETTLRDEDDEELAEDADGDNDEKLRVLDSRKSESRTIYCLDLRVSQDARQFLDEVQRIVGEASQRRDVVEPGPNLLNWLEGQPNSEQLDRFLSPLNSTALGGQVTSAGADQGGGNGNGHAPAKALTPNVAGSSGPRSTAEDAGRRWYPVIDFSRCTNCMECIDFCLFGVYGVDQADTILVEQPDNCRKGCPACSRVCPENAIIFPQHKTPAIAGSMEAAGSLKIDLSKLFGAPDDGKSAVELAALERDEQLILAGRDAVGLSVGVPKRQVNRDAAAKDHLDSLIDQLDDLDV
jgi:NAD-dependent dihydropyrimidine dehydrogenase PreA subunit